MATRSVPAAAASTRAAHPLNPPCAAPRCPSAPSASYAPTAPTHPRQALRRMSSRRTTGNAPRVPHPQRLSSLDDAPPPQSAGKHLPASRRRNNPGGRAASPARPDSPAAPPAHPPPPDSSTRPACSEPASTSPAFRPARRRSPPISAHCAAAAPFRHPAHTAAASHDYPPSIHYGGKSSLPRPPPAHTVAWLHAVRPLPRTGHPCSAVPSCPARINPLRRTANSPYAPAYARSCAPRPPSACRIPGACSPSPFAVSASPSIAENAACGNGVCSHCLSSRGGENACLRGRIRI